jgi:hypothetical protein
MILGAREARIWPNNAFVISAFGFIGLKLLVTL